MTKTVFLSPKPNLFFIFNVHAASMLLHFTLNLIFVLLANTAAMQ